MSLGVSITSGEFNGKMGLAILEYHYQNQKLVNAASKYYACKNEYHHNHLLDFPEMSRINEIDRGFLYCNFL